MPDINVVARPTARTPRASHFTFDLSTIKDDLGICGVDNDAWLERRIANVWARFEKYTSRYLPVPPAQFTDDWGRLASGPHSPNQPPVLATGPVGSPFLRVSPVVSIDAMHRNGQLVDPVEVRFEPATGKLFSLSGASWHGGHDVSGELAQAEVAITYTAGWDEVPGDLYEALLGVLGQMWGQRSAQAAGVPGGGAATSINVVDVGTIELGTNEGNAFVGATMKGVRIEDPLLGPWGYVLQEYIDYRVQIGSPLIPVTEWIGPGSQSSQVVIGLPAVLSARATGGVAITTTLSAFTLDAPDTNIGGYWDHATQTFRPPPGAYQFNATLACTSNNNNADCSLLLLRNGSEYARATASAVADNIMSPTLALALVAEAGDAFTLAMVADRTGMTVLNPGSGFSVLGRLFP